MNLNTYVNPHQFHLIETKKISYIILRNSHQLRNVAIASTINFYRNMPISPTIRYVNLDFKDLKPKSISKVCVYIRRFQTIREALLLLGYDMLTPGANDIDASENMILKNMNCTRESITHTGVIVFGWV